MQEEYIDFEHFVIGSQVVNEFRQQTVDFKADKFSSQVGDELVQQPLNT